MVVAAAAAGKCMLPEIVVGVCSGAPGAAHRGPQVRGVACSLPVAQQEGGKGRHAGKDRDTDTAQPLGALALNEAGVVYTQAGTQLLLLVALGVTGSADTLVRPHRPALAVQLLLHEAVKPRELVPRPQLLSLVPLQPRPWQAPGA